MTMREFEIRTDPLRIDAPINVVWTVLIEVDRYSEWNPFTPQARTDFTIGSPANLLVRMGPAKFRISENVCAFEKPRLIAWEKKFGARWLLLAVREQHLDPAGKTSCSYHNTDRLTGVLAAMVLVCFGAYMRRGFADVAEGLKAYAEGPLRGNRSEWRIGGLPHASRPRGGSLDHTASLAVSAAASVTLPSPGRMSPPAHAPDRLPIE